MEGRGRREEGDLSANKNRIYDGICISYHPSLPSFLSPSLPPSLSLSL